MSLYLHHITEPNKLLVTKTQLQKATARRGLLSSVSFLLRQPGVSERPFGSAAVHQRSLTQEGTAATQIRAECLSPASCSPADTGFEQLFPRVKSPCLLIQTGSKHSGVRWRLAPVRLAQTDCSGAKYTLQGLSQFQTNKIWQLRFTFMPRELKSGKPL